MRTRATWRPLAALFVVTLLAASCGEDGESTATVDITTTIDTHSADHDSTDPGTTDHGTTDHGTTDHDHDTADGEESQPGTHDSGEPGVVDVAADGAPTVDIEVSADPSGGVDIEVLTENYTIAPRSVSSEHVEGEGHFHLYVDGVKVLRFYNEWIHYPGVDEGDVDIAVTLAANDHRAYAIDGEPIRSAVTFTVPPHEHGDHSHDEPSPVEFVGDAPALALEVLEDPKAGWNAFVTLDGMIFNPEHTSGDHVDGEGHLRIYANGQQLGRLYGPATHLAALPDGEVEISVVAYTNDHQPYVIGGRPISAAATVTVAS